MTVYTKLPQTDQTSKEEFSQHRSPFGGNCEVGYIIIPICVALTCPRTAPHTCILRVSVSDQRDCLSTSIQTGAAVVSSCHTVPQRAPRRQTRGRGLPGFVPLGAISSTFAPIPAKRRVLLLAVDKCRTPYLSNLPQNCTAAAEWANTEITASLTFVCKSYISPDQVMVLI